MLYGLKNRSKLFCLFRKLYFRGRELVIDTGIRFPIFGVGINYHHRDLVPHFRGRDSSMSESIAALAPSPTEKTVWIFISRRCRNYPMNYPIAKYPSRVGGRNYFVIFLLFTYY